MSETMTRRRKKNKLIQFISLVLPLIVFGIGYFFFNVYIVTTYSIHTISGSSMENELQDKDLVLIKMDAPLSRYSIISLTHQNEMYVKRIIGIPGDAIVVNQNRISIDTGGQGNFQSIYDFELSDSVAEKFRDQTQIPENAYFVIGDNSDISKDSREFGWVTRESIEGKLIFNFD